MSTSTTLHRLVSDVVLCEVNPTWSRDTAVLAANSDEVSIGTVLGEIKTRSATAVAKAGNTGNGTCTMDATTPVLQGAKVGTYAVRFTSATAFTVEDPDGNVIGTGVNGTAFADDIKFATAAGGTAFIAGDGFDIIVSPASAAVAAKAGNTGDGTCTMDATTPVLYGAKTGVYTVRFTSATAFKVSDPHGTEIGTGANGTAFATEIKFTTAAGTAAFVAGDGFDITAAPPSPAKLAPLSFAARDGSDKPVAIALASKATSTSDQKIPVGARGLVVDPANLVWPAGATDAQKDAALRVLKDKGIVPRATI